MSRTKLSNKHKIKSRKFKGSRKNTSRRNYRPKTRRMRRYVGRGPSTSTRKTDEDNVQCCMCEKNVSKDSNPLIPQICLEKYGYSKAHRICQQCWWGDKDSIGFAKEGISHKCPGCEKGLPLNEYVKKHTGPIEVINLVDTE
jgi:hypothetical protein